MNLPIKISISNSQRAKNKRRTCTAYHREELDQVVAWRSLIPVLDMPIHLKTTPQEAAAYAARRKRKTTASSSSSSLWIEEESRIYDNVPQRWRTSFDEFLHVDPDSLDGDDYTEWVRTGMYRQV